jgi:iron-sulfur cluster repair protein YtfE (RIC family)
VTDPDHLDLRRGLPEALRTLLADFPREAWEGNRNFEGIVRFWLDRHMMFRRLTEGLREDVERLLDKKLDPQAYGPRLARLGSMLVNELHGHHHIEDAHYFPVLTRAEPRLASGFELLDRDHQALDVHLEEFTEGANGLLSRLDGSGYRDAAGAFHAVLGKFDGFLDRHLLDEEDLVVPVILKHGPDSLG